MAERLSLNNTTIGYPGKTVIEGACIDIAPGQFVCLSGRNGAGKSTLLKTIAGFLPLLCGEVRIDGRNLGDFSRKELARMVGIVLTHTEETGLMTVREMVALGRTPYTGFFGNLREEDSHAVDEALKAMNITQLASLQTSTLSDGERQKAMIAKVLAQQTPLILMDEPTAFLDFASKVELMKMLKNLAHEQQKTIIISTHDINLAMKLADDILLVTNDGRLLQNPSSEELAAFIGKDAMPYI